MKDKGWGADVGQTKEPERKAVRDFFMKTSIRKKIMSLPSFPENNLDKLGGRENWTCKKILIVGKAAAAWGICVFVRLCWLT